MAKRYTDQLAEWAKKREASRPRQDKNVVAFLAVRTDVKEAMDAGYALKTIWEHLHETKKIAYRYETFLRHVRRHIKQTPQPEIPPADLKDNKAEAKTTKKEQEPPPSVSGFRFDATPKKEDLI